MHTKSTWNIYFIDINAKELTLILCGLIKHFHKGLNYSVHKDSVSSIKATFWGDVSSIHSSLNVIRLAVLKRNVGVFWPKRFEKTLKNVFLSTRMCSFDGPMYESHHFGHSLFLSDFQIKCIAVNASIDVQRTKEPFVLSNVVMVWLELSVTI